MRTQEQIIADCEKRFAEIEAESQAPRNRRPCRSCRHMKLRWEGLGEGPECHEPLVKGYGSPVLMHRFGVSVEPEKTCPPLCGPEKALWQPKPTFWQRIVERLMKE